MCIRNTVITILGRIVYNVLLEALDLCLKKCKFRNEKGWLTLNAMNLVMLKRQIEVA